MSNFFDKLTPINKGADVREVASSERMTALQDAVKALWRGENIRDGRGFFIDRGIGGVSMRTKKVNNRPGGDVIERAAFDILKTRPAYIPAPETPPTLQEGEFEVWVNIGTVNRVLPTNFKTALVVNSSDFYIALKVSLSQASKNITVTSVQIESSDDITDFVNAPWVDQELSQTLPAYVYVYLGHVDQASKTVSQDGKGGVRLTVHMSAFVTRGNGLATRYTREVREERIG